MPLPSPNYANNTTLRTVKEAEAQDTVQAVVLTVPLPPPATPSSGASRAVLFLETRDRHQSGTTTRSERVLELDPKFDKPRMIADDPNVVKLRILSIQEGSHPVRVAQDID